ncbi:hypothetical protein BH10BAC2_BH10BAC2_41270 [soil metagenome]
MLLWSTFIVGSSYLLVSLFIYNSLLETATTAQVLQSPFAGILGKSFRLGGRYESSFWGIILYYIISLLFSTIFFFLSAYFNFIKKYTLLASLCYGLLSFVVVVYIFIPLVGIPQSKWSINFINLSMFIFIVGLQIGLINKYFRKQANTSLV